MNFTELFAKLPTSTLQDWETAARKQLKGKPLESIDISMLEGTVTTPFAIGTDTTTQGGGSQGWVQFSSFAASGEVSGAMLLEALNGGAQGLELSFSNLKRVSSELSELRFDFISLRINNLSIKNQAALIDLIPQDQRKGANLLVSLDNGVKAKDYKELVDVVGTVFFVLSPKLVVGEQASLQHVFDAAKEQFYSVEKSTELDSVMAALSVEIVLSSDYLKNIIFTHAVRLLFANLYHAYGVAEPLPRPYVFGRISHDGATDSHENYLIDATARAVAGISGGLDALTIEAYPESDQLLAARRSRNIQNVLAIEGLLGMPLNAVAGAAFFEAAAKELVLSVWPHS
ncbi:MAG: methylmalonyl-CoA mutase family protein [Saprospiraceae bacterium]